MGGFRLPKSGSGEEKIDLAKYGGEGTLLVHAPRTMDSVVLSNKIFELADKDGIKINNEKDIVNLSQGRYKLQTIVLTMQACIEAMDEDGTRKLTEDEIYALPAELMKDIMEAIGRLTAFPLEQTGGKAQN